MLSVYTLMRWNVNLIWRGSKWFYSVTFIGSLNTLQAFAYRLDLLQFFTVVILCDAHPGSFQVSKKKWVIEIFEIHWWWLEDQIEHLCLSWIPYMLMKPVNFFLVSVGWTEQKCYWNNQSHNDIKTKCILVYINKYIKYFNWYSI